MHNPWLAEKQKLDETTREIIDKLHLLRGYLGDEILNLNKKKNPARQNILNLYRDWIENEKLLQKLWNFPEDDSYYQRDTKEKFKDVKVIREQFPEYFI